MTMQQATELRSFGRKGGRALSPRQQRLLDELLPQLQLDLATPPPVLTSLFTAPVAETWLEIGFGGAEHMIWQATHSPGVGIIGCEPFVDGVVKALTAIDEQRLGNVRLHGDDARDVLRWLPDSSIARAFILFPDPWPKARHRKRRLVAGPTLELLARVMKPGSELRVGTDIADYAHTMLAAFAGQSSFVWTARGGLASHPLSAQSYPRRSPQLLLPLPARLTRAAVSESNRRHFTVYAARRFA
jgi:tRNA (guanine-N7-)-methyltransferase